MVEYKITIVIKAENEVQLSKKLHGIIEALEAWIRVKRRQYRSLKLEILEVSSFSGADTVSVQDKH